MNIQELQAHASDDLLPWLLPREPEFFVGQQFANYSEAYKEVTAYEKASGRKFLKLQSRKAKNIIQRKCAEAMCPFNLYISRPKVPRNQKAKYVPHGELVVEHVLQVEPRSVLKHTCNACVVNPKQTSRQITDTLMEKGHRAVVHLSSKGLEE